MTLSEEMKNPRPPICDIRSECRIDADAYYARSLFERPWDALVVKRGDDGKYRSYTECCDRLTPA
jgi:hypothetical protein